MTCSRETPYTYTLLTNNSFRVWLGGLCDKRRMPDLSLVRIDVVPGELKKENIEMLELSLNKIETSLRAKKVVLKVLDASGTKLVTLSAALEAAWLKLVTG
jgi:hypothetical protein